jgi:hypothetical protein
MVFIFAWAAWLDQPRKSQESRKAKDDSKKSTGPLEKESHMLQYAVNIITTIIDSSTAY